MSRAYALYLSRRGHPPSRCPSIPATTPCPQALSAPLKTQVGAPLAVPAALPGAEPHSGGAPMNTYNGRCPTGHHLLSRHVRRHYLSGDRWVIVPTTGANAFIRVRGGDSGVSSSPGSGSGDDKSSRPGRVPRSSGMLTVGTGAGRSQGRVRAGRGFGRRNLRRGGTPGSAVRGVAERTRGRSGHTEGPGTHPRGARPFVFPTRGRRPAPPANSARWPPPLPGAPGAGTGLSPDRRPPPAARKSAGEPPCRRSSTTPSARPHRCR